MKKTKTAAERLINKDVSAVTLKQQLPDSLTQHMTQDKLVLSSMSHTDIYNMPREYWTLDWTGRTGGELSAIWRCRVILMLLNLKTKDYTGATCKLPRGPIRKNYNNAYLRFLLGCESKGGRQVKIR